MPEDRRSAGRSSSALAAVVLTVSVEVTVLLAGGVTGLGLTPQVGPLVTTGATEQPRVTAELKPFVEPTVIVAVAETPGLPDVTDKAPFVTVKLAVVACVYFATKASVPPPLVVCLAPVVAGKSVEPVLPVT